MRSKSCLALKQHNPVRSIEAAKSDRGEMYRSLRFRYPAVTTKTRGRFSEALYEPVQSF